MVTVRKLLLSSRLRGVLLTTALLFALIFSVLTLVQDAYVRGLFDRDLATRLQQTNANTSSILLRGGKWKLTEYRDGSDLGPGDFAITTGDNQLIDIEAEDQPGLINQAVVPDFERSSNVKTIINEAGEQWLILSRRLLDGRVYIGTTQTNPPQGLQFLKRNISKFGTTLATASKIRSHNLDNQIDGYLVVNSLGHLVSIFGGLPFIVSVSLPTHPVDGKVYFVDSPTGKLAVLASSFNEVKPSARIISIENIDIQSGIINGYRRFNALIAIFAWVVLLLVVSSILIVNEIRQRQQELSVAEALKNGESQAVEFKEGFVDRSLAQAITAFSNTNHGNIFIGIADNGSVTGISGADAQEKDRLQQKIRNIAGQSVRPPSFVRISFLDHESKVVKRIFVPRGSEPLYMYENRAYIRHLTSNVQAGPAEVQTVIKNWQKNRAS